MAYTVVAGDNPWAIWRDMGPKDAGMSFDDFLASNGLTRNDAMIHPGDVMDLGDGAGDSEEPAGDTPAEPDKPTTDDSGTLEIVEAVPAEEAQTKVGVGKGEVTILTSQSMQWYFDSTTGKWLVSYKLPNSERSVVYEATGSQMDAIFGDGFRPDNYISDMDFAAITQQEGVTFGGDVVEVHGTGSYEAHVNATIARGLDEGTLPDWAKNDPAVMDIIYIANAENKSAEWMLDQIYSLPSFQKRFPGIAALTGIGLTTTEAVTGFIEMEVGVKELVLKDGGNPASVLPGTIGDMLSKGHSLTDVEWTFGIFNRMEKSAGAMEAFNEVLAARGMAPLDADGQFEFLAGNGAAELYDVWEEASLHNAAIDAGLDIGVEGAIDLARRTEGLTSYDSALEGLNDAAQKLLRFRTQLDLGQYGLEEQDLIDLSLGLAPSSGANQADIARNMDRVVRSAQAQIQQARVNPFRQFTPEGVPQATSLSRSAVESA